MCPLHHMPSINWASLCRCHDLQAQCHGQVCSIICWLLESFVHLLDHCLINVPQWGKWSDQCRKDVFSGMHQVLQQKAAWGIIHSHLCFTSSVSRKETLINMGSLSWHDETGTLFEAPGMFLGLGWCRVKINIQIHHDFSVASCSATPHTLSPHWELLMVTILILINILTVSEDLISTEFAFNKMCNYMGNY